MDSSTEEQPAYTDEEEARAEAPFNQLDSQDVELSTIAPLSQADPNVQQPSPEPVSSESNTDFLMSGALTTGGENDEEPDAPLPLVVSQNRMPRVS